MVLRSQNLWRRPRGILREFAFHYIEFAGFRFHYISPAPALPRRHCFFDLDSPLQTGHNSCAMNTCTKTGRGYP